MGYFIICKKDYDFEGQKFKKGDFDFYSSSMPLFSDKWRKATNKEVSNHLGFEYPTKIKKTILYEEDIPNEDHPLKTLGI